MALLRSWIRDLVLAPSRVIGAFLLLLALLLAWRCWSGYTLAATLRRSGMQPATTALMLIALQAGIFAAWGASHWLPERWQSRAGQGRIVALALALLTGLALLLVH